MQKIFLKKYNVQIKTNKIIKNSPLIKLKSPFMNFNIIL